MSSGPLSTIGVGADLSCQVAYTGDTSYEFYPPSSDPADCGTLLATGGGLYAPDFASHDTTATGRSLGTYTPYTMVSQTGPSGSGTSAAPYQVVTTADAGETGLRLTQTDSYVAGDSSVKTDVQITNTSPTDQSVVLYRAGDCYLANSDYSNGIYASASGGVGCLDPPSSRLEEWTPLTADSRHVETFYDTLWSDIATQGPLPNTCDCNTNEDSAAGLSWNLTIPAGQSASVSEKLSFGHSAMPLRAAGRVIEGKSGAPTLSRTSWPALFADPTPSDRGAADYFATIDWGDGSLSTGTISTATSSACSQMGLPMPSGASCFSVTARHTYAASGPQTFTVDITDVPDGRTASVEGLAEIAHSTSPSPGKATGILTFDIPGQAYTTGACSAVLIMDTNTIATATHCFSDTSLLTNGAYRFEFSPVHHGNCYQGSDPSQVGMLSDCERLGLGTDADGYWTGYGGAYVQGDVTFVVLNDQSSIGLTFQDAGVLGLPTVFNVPRGKKWHVFAFPDRVGDWDVRAKDVGRDFTKPGDTGDYMIPCPIPSSPTPSSLCWWGVTKGMGGASGGAWVNSTDLPSGLGGVDHRWCPPDPTIPPCGGPWISGDAFDSSVMGAFLQSQGIQYRN